MSYGSNHWHCSTARCKREGLVSVIVLIQSPGGKHDRKKKSTNVTRLCRTCLDEFIANVPHQQLQDKVQAVCDYVVPLKPKAVK